MPGNQAVYVNKPDIQDPANAIEIRSLPVPEPKDGEVLVKLLLRPINPCDVYTLKGLYPAAPSGEFVPGSDGMGVVESAGGSKFAMGQRVAIAGSPVNRGEGTWQEYCVLHENELMTVPDSVSDEDAAQFWVRGVTSMPAL